MISFCCKKLMKILKNFLKVEKLGPNNKFYKNFIFVILARWSLHLFKILYLITYYLYLYNLKAAESRKKIEKIKRSPSINLNFYLKFFLQDLWVDGVKIWSVLSSYVIVFYKLCLKRIDLVLIHNWKLNWSLSQRWLIYFIISFCLVIVIIL